MSEIRYRARRSAGSIPIERELEDGTTEVFELRVRVMDHALLKQIAAVADQAKRFQKELEEATDEDQAIMAGDKIGWMIEQINLLAINEVKPSDLDGLSITDLNFLLQDMTNMASASARPGDEAEKKHLAKRSRS